jgi:hypothetical protein
MQQLVENANQLVIDERAAAQRRVLQSTDLLLDDNFKRGGADEECRGGTLPT